MHLAGSAVAREPEGSAEARRGQRGVAGSAETRVSAGSAEASALVPRSAARQQKATGVTPAWRSISIAAQVLPAAVWAPPSVRERAATLAWPAAVVVTAAVQAVATRPRAEQVAPPTGQATVTRPTAGAVLQAAVVPVPVPRSGCRISAHRWPGKRRLRAWRWRAPSRLWLLYRRRRCKGHSGLRSRLGESARQWIHGAPADTCLGGRRPLLVSAGNQ